MAQADPRKWFMPGWRIEQRFSPGVLIGNWSEERYTFEKGNYGHNSTHRLDFRKYGEGVRPDVTIRRNGHLRNEGLGSKHLFEHHGNKYANNKISWYDEHYNGRWKESGLPPMRDWNGHHMAWMPERSDHPVQGNSTNFGLIEDKKKQWQNALIDRQKPVYLSVYTDSYQTPSAEGRVNRRCAIPREFSSSLHPYNKINHNMVLRSASGPTFKTPENLPLEMTAVSD